MKKYIVATTKEWNVEAFKKNAPFLEGEWHLITDRENLDLVKEIKPEYVFFPHWSWIVPEDIVNNYNCVCFHMTDVPYGRGGSPLQNLILAGHRNTKLTALKMVKELDAGPVYLKKDLKLDNRSAQDIFVDVSELVYDMIKTIISEDIKPKPQEGQVFEFKRRNPEDSRIPESCDLETFYDYVRMLDADTYPRAFVELDNLKICFSGVEKKEGKLTARVIVEEK